ncbi:glycine betaine ABC transporter substrate-binding protein [Ornithinibacillus sp. BX22]|uniref:Glycine betaine ABC transporter substrate-binding protein n=2 Tax=Ornithinibacillus TaxID=484508 RepID=A0A923L524_9BACI|nr:MULTISPECIES: glycine betaine ABC transporter substrate-binding protein [Ornithinibacillus]MBC5636628.1 glycine betaine ABC transporter substrate-binding protein [Ornithinibacillus hominis]MBS3680530.1 glycine betaine ABC transporter substrate-binding protein [Ornithinibacillus massiliensis]
MFKRNWKRLGLIAGLSLSLFAAGCSSDNDSSSDEGSSEAGKEINLAYVTWDTEIASTNVVGKVLEDLGYDVKLTALDNSIMWEAVANGEADAMVAAWLPATHGSQFEQYGDQMEQLGPNLEGAKIGLVVPSYMDVDSIEDLSDEAGKKITGIEPGAGVVATSEQALEDYENLEDWEVVTSSSGAMATALGEAYENEEEIIVTGWSPHWKFAKYDLKYLEDPKGTFGGAETIETMVRKGLKDDLPEAYQVLDNFFWTPEDLESVMLDISEGMNEEEAAAKWVEENPDKVAEWTKGIE